MKTLLIVFLAALAAANAVPINLTWDDTNPPGYVTKFTLYRKVWSGTSATWQKVKDIPAADRIVTVEWVAGQANVYSLTCWAGALESAARAEIDVAAPKIVNNLRDIP